MKTLESEERYTPRSEDALKADLLRIGDMLPANLANKFCFNLIADTAQLFGVDDGSGWRLADLPVGGNLVISAGFEAEKQEVAATVFKKRTDQNGAPFLPDYLYSFLVMHTKDGTLYYTKDGHGFPVPGANPVNANILVVIMISLRTAVLARMEEKTPSSPRFADR